VAYLAAVRSIVNLRTTRRTFHGWSSPIIEILSIKTTQKPATSACSTPSVVIAWHRQKRTQAAGVNCQAKNVESDFGLHTIS
jgi:hypothetical protein